MQHDKVCEVAAAPSKLCGGSFWRAAITSIISALLRHSHLSHDILYIEASNYIFKYHRERILSTPNEPGLNHIHVSVQVCTVLCEFKYLIRCVLAYKRHYCGIASSASPYAEMILISHLDAIFAMKMPMLHYRRLGISSIISLAYRTFHMYG